MWGCHRRPLLNYGIYMYSNRRMSKNTRPPNHPGIDNTLNAASQPPMTSLWLTLVGIPKLPACPPCQHQYIDKKHIKVCWGSADNPTEGLDDFHRPSHLCWSARHRMQKFHMWTLVWKLSIKPYIRLLYYFNWKIKSYLIFVYRLFYYPALEGWRQQNLDCHNRLRKRYKAGPLINDERVNNCFY